MPWRRTIHRKKKASGRDEFVASLLGLAGESRVDNPLGRGRLARLPGEVRQDLLLACFDPLTRYLRLVRKWQRV